MHFTVQLVRICFEIDRSETTDTTYMGSLRTYWTIYIYTLWTVEYSSIHLSPYALLSRHAYRVVFSVNVMPNMQSFTILYNRKPIISISADISAKRIDIVNKLMSEWFTRIWMCCFFFSVLINSNYCVPFTSNC